MQEEYSFDGTGTGVAASSSVVGRSSGMISPIVSSSQYASSAAGMSTPVGGATTTPISFSTPSFMVGGGGAINSSILNMNKSTMVTSQLNSEVRMAQILDDADHKRCSEGSQRALLAEKLENLRQLAKYIQMDDWKFVKKSVITIFFGTTVTERNSILSTSHFKR